MPVVTLNNQPVYGLPGARSGGPYDFLLSKMTGLVHRWKFTEPSGSFLDSVGNLTLTPSGVFTYGVAGPTGGAVTFGASAKAVAAGSGNIPLGNNPRTMLVVYKPATTTKQCLFSCGPANANNQWWTAFQTELDCWGNDMSFGGGSVGHWHLYVAYYTNPNGGARIDTGSATRVYGSIGTGISNFQIGLSTYGDGQFSGSIDDIAIFNRSITYAEWLALYNAVSSSALWT